MRTKGNRTLHTLLSFIERYMYMPLRFCENNSDCAVTAYRTPMCGEFYIGEFTSILYGETTIDHASRVGPGHCTRDYMPLASYIYNFFH